MFLDPIKVSAPEHIKLQPCVFWLQVAVSPFWSFGDCMLFNVLDSEPGSCDSEVAFVVMLANPKLKHTAWCLSQLWLAILR